MRVEDGRLGLERLDDAAYDLVVGDAFGGVTVPWHLTTREAVAEVRRVLAGDGLYVMNLIDHADLDFARAEVATLAERFYYVAVASQPATLALEDGGNLVVVAGSVRSTSRRGTSGWPSARSTTTCSPARRSSGGSATPTCSPTTTPWLTSC